MNHKLRGIFRLVGAVALLGALLTGVPRFASAQQSGPGRILFTTLPSFGGLAAANPDGNIGINLTPNFGNGGQRLDTTPSASANGSKIAFASVRNTGGQGDTHIWIMNGDGTGAHALTTPGFITPGTAINDQNPAISPDGTKIAFVSNRFAYTYPNGGPTIVYTDVYVINTDGTGLHQVTQTQVHMGSGTFGSSVVSVAWAPDSNTIAYRGIRLITPADPESYGNGLFTIRADGTGDTVLQPLVSTGQSYALDWSANGRYIGVTYGGEAQGAPTFRIILFDLFTHTAANFFVGDSSLRTGAAGTLRFSPDSTQFAYERNNPNQAPNVLVGIVNVDGSNDNTTPILLAQDTWIWWQRGAAIPTPAKLTLSYSVPPDLLLLKAGGDPVAVLPTLLDANGNVIVHAVAEWDPSDSRYFTVDANGNATGIKTQDTGPLSLTASNGGITSAPTKVMVDTPVLQVKLQLIRNVAGATEVRILFANSGAGGATNTTISAITLDGVSTTDTLPATRGSVLADTTDSLPTIFHFAQSAKPSGTTVLLKVQGKYDWYGTFNTTLRVALP